MHFFNYKKIIFGCNSIIRYWNTPELGWTVADIDPQGQTSIAIALKTDNITAFTALLERESFENNKYVLDTTSELYLVTMIITLGIWSKKLLYQYWLA